ncbi:MAG: type II toxin-antitoxin system RelE/ParE family toxin [Phycisphaerales bacterium]|nr:type II toxin-antitoxin system RelE/ParE family toxin [Phycisphaerales bacterium]
MDGQKVVFTPQSLADLREIDRRDGEEKSKWLSQECETLGHPAIRLQADRLGGSVDLYRLSRQQYYIIFCQIDAATGLILIKRIRNRYHSWT